MEGVGDVVEGIDGQAPAAVLDTAKGAAVDADEVPQRLLGEVAPSPEATDAVAYLGAAPESRRSGRSIGHVNTLDGARSHVSTTKFPF